MILMSVQVTHDASVISASSTAGPRKSRPMIDWLRNEPLLQFCLIGGLIFGLDFVLHPPGQDDKTIVVTKALQDGFVRNFSEDGDRFPTPTQLNNMIESWVASEVLYREGKALGMDKGDTMIRDRIAFKLQSLVFDQVKVDRPTEADLRAWFEKTRMQYDEPERVGFLLTPATDEATARQQLEDIRAQRESAELRDQTRAFLGRPVQSLPATFGDGFAAQFAKLVVNEWTVIQANDGWHVVRLDVRKPGVPATYEEVVDNVRRSFLNEETRKRAWATVQKFRTNYTVKIEPR
jgi:PPIC-type PPIASE domain